MDYSLATKQELKPVNSAPESVRVEPFSYSAHDRAKAWRILDGEYALGTLWSTGLGRWFAQTNAADLRHGSIAVFDNPTEGVAYLANRAVTFDPAQLTVT
jgi:hypothetical protein